MSGYIFVGDSFSRQFANVFRTKMAVSYLAIIATLCLGASGYSKGPPAEICKDLTLLPVGHQTDFQKSASNYILVVKPLKPKAGIYGVELSSRNNDTFKGN